MLKTQQEIITEYNSRSADLQNTIQQLKQTIQRLMWCRILLFILEIFLFILFVSVTDTRLIIGLGVSMLLPVIVFIAVVQRQVALNRKKQAEERLLWVFQNETGMLLGKNNGYEDGHAFSDGNHAYTDDLDIFGADSVFAMINRSRTHEGMSQLAQYMQHPATRAEIVSRQEAVHELKEKIEVTFNFRAIVLEQQPDQLVKVKYKIGVSLPDEIKFTHTSWLRIYVRMVPFLMGGLLLGGIVFGHNWWLLLLVAAILNGFLTFLFSDKVNKVHAGFSGLAQALGAYGSAIQWTEHVAWGSAYITRLFNTDGPQTIVSQQIRQLSKIIQAFDARLNMLVGAVLNIFYLWDLRCSVKLDEWHTTSSHNIAEGLDRIPAFEALISLATLAHNYPKWVFPIIKEGFEIKAAEIGHPLLAGADRNVLNQYTMEGKPFVDIITGSNMAGKSTFLRTIGVNMVLAYAGGPVCATAMELPILRVLSYMRIRDSLNNSTSTFKAELNRLKMILQTIQSDNHCFVLIDEMLRGTNSRDKYMGSKVFIEKLIRLKTPALFATHDLQLSELANYHPDAVRNYHFDIHIDEQDMHFDYKLKDGACNTFNAAVLLKGIGLALD